MRQRHCNPSDCEIPLMNSLNSASSELPSRAGKPTKQVISLESAASGRKKDKSPRLEADSELVISCCIPHAEASFISGRKCFIKHTILLGSVLH
jgi:hypothetical protein